MTKTRTHSLLRSSLFDLLEDMEKREAVLRELASLVKNGERALDIATGSGYLARYLIRQNAEVFCVDLDPRALEVAKRSLGKGVYYVVADAATLPFKSNAFDIALSWSALVHIQNWIAVLEEMFRTASRAGTAEPEGEFAVRAFRDFSLKHKAPTIKEIEVEFEKHTPTKTVSKGFFSIISSKG